MSFIAISKPARSLGEVASSSHQYKLTMRITNPFVDPRSIFSHSLASSGAFFNRGQLLEPIRHFGCKDRYHSFHSLMKACKSVICGIESMAPLDLSQRNATSGRHLLSSPPLRIVFKCDEFIFILFCYQSLQAPPQPQGKCIQREIFLSQKFDAFPYSGCCISTAQLCDFLCNLPEFVTQRYNQREIDSEFQFRLSYSKINPWSNFLNGDIDALSDQAFFRSQKTVNRHP